MNPPLIKRLYSGINVAKNYAVYGVKKTDGHYVVNGEKVFDKVIISAPLDVALNFFEVVPEAVLTAGTMLRYNKISNVLWETSGVDATWSYYPEESTLFHRHIHIGNFLQPARNLSITESLGDVSYERMIEEGAKFPYLKRPLAYNVSNHAYVLQDGNKEWAAKIVKDYIESMGFHLCGRFAEWEYYNMDACIGSAMDLADRIG